MIMSFKVLYYVNQFFGQVGGEDKAGMEPEFRKEHVGVTMQFDKSLGDDGEVIGTIICGDNYFNENKEEALNEILKMVEEHKPDVFVAGPAFNAGRYGMACASIVNEVHKKFQIPVVTGMYIENPGLDVCKEIAYVVETTDSAAGMRKALGPMSKLTIKLGKGEDIKEPAEEGYIPQGKRLTVISDKIGAQRASDMLLARLKGEAFETELPMPVFDTVDPAKGIVNLKDATIALVTSGGIVPKGNPDRIQSASAQKWGKYGVDEIDTLQGGYYTIHGGYDPVYANEDANRVAPLDILKQYEEEGMIGKVFEYFYTTTGTGTSVANSVKFGQEIGKELKEAGVDGVILTST